MAREKCDEKEQSVESRILANGFGVVGDIGNHVDTF